MAPVIGLANEYFSSGQHHNYGPGFYSNVVISMLDVVAVCFLDIPETSRTSPNMMRDLKTVFRSSHVLFFTLGVFVHGTLMGPIWSYAFLYFKSLGSPQSLLGLQLTVQCFLGEVPVMFFAGCIISKLGFKHSISLSVGGTVMRLAVYAFGTNPWMMLPVEMLHGLSFGLFYSAMTLYANRIAPKGTEATVQGIVGGMFEGAGKQKHLSWSHCLNGRLYSTPKTHTCVKSHAPPHALSASGGNDRVGHSRSNSNSCFAHACRNRGRQRCLWTVVRHRSAADNAVLRYLRIGLLGDSGRSQLAAGRSVRRQG